MAQNWPKCLKHMTSLQVVIHPVGYSISEFVGESFSFACFSPNISMRLDL